MPKRDNTKTLEPIEVLVVVLLCVFAVAATAPVLLASRTDAYRMQCAGNLSQIGKAMLIYANDYDDVFPRSGGRSGTWDRVISNWRAANRFTAYGMTASGEAGRASISSCFYLLVKYGDVSPGTFVCPGDSGTTEFILANAGAGDRDLTDLWDFGREAYKHCSYSYHMPFGLFALTTSSDPGMAIAADRNPWIDSPAGKAKDISMFVPRGNRAAAKHGNALAHGEEGQNVLFVDGHISFEQNPYCGLHDDNIYTYWDGGDVRRGAAPLPLMASPMDRIDSLLVHDPPPTTVSKSASPVDSANLKLTSVLATLDCPVPERRNAIWCSTFQMAWDRLKNEVIGEPLKVRDADEIASRLNQSQFPDKGLEDESFYAAVGIVKDGIVDKIHKEMESRFPSQPKPVFEKLDALPQGIKEKTIVAYSFLAVEVDFDHPFYVNKRAFEFRDSDGTPTSVASFTEDTGFGSSESVREQVGVLYYRDIDQAGPVDFAVDLSEATEPYQVVLARMRRQSTLGRSVATAEEMISRFKADPDYQVLREFRSIDTLIVPDILYKLTHNFTELEGRPLAHAQWPGYFILEAMQMVDFSLSKTGVILRSESRMTVPPFAVRRGQVVESRHFHFDSPFLIYVKKRGRDHSPFFAMWVDNAELMQ